MNIKLIKCQEKDLEKLIEISRVTYYESFENLCSKKIMDQYLNDAFHPRKLLQELTNKNTKFYFLYADETIVGYIKLNELSAQSDIKDETSIELERIYVIKKYQGKGLGEFLLKKSIEFAREKSKKYLWLGVWKKNKKAIKFYEKNGFKKFAEHDFYMGDERQNNFLFRIQIANPNN